MVEGREKEGVTKAGHRGHGWAEGWAKRGKRAETGERWVRDGPN